MEKKKLVKPIVIATSVAAVVGIGAVSFAAWSGSDHTSETITGNTDQIATIGDITVTPSAASGSALTSLNKLAPVDQSDDTMPSGAVKYWEFDLSCATTGDQNVKYTISGSLTAGSGDDATAIGGATLRWSETTPSALTDGTAISSTAANITGTKVYVFLAAEDTDAMNAAISITFSVAEAA